VGFPTLGGVFIQFVQTGGILPLNEYLIHGKYPYNMGILPNKAASVFVQFIQHPFT